MARAGFFRVDEMASGRVPDIKIRFVSTAISEATSLIFFPPAAVGVISPFVEYRNSDGAELWVFAFDKANCHRTLSPTEPTPLC